MKINSLEFYMTIQNRIDNKGERKGQAYYNVAFNLQPHVVVETPQRVDPFYDDSRCEAFIDWVRNRMAEITSREGVHSSHTRVINGKTYLFRHMVNSNGAWTRVYLLDENADRQLVKFIVWRERDSR